MIGKLVLGQNLKSYRRQNKISQEELAARADLSTRGYGKIERGEVSASVETLDKLAHSTGLTLSELLKES